MERTVRKLMPNARNMRHVLPFVCAGCLAAWMFSCNPFAPAIEDGPDGAGNILSDQRTVDGIFQNFRYAYSFKDTTIYGNLLAQDFIFTYRDYEKMFDDSWARDEEMRITSNLFQNAGNLNLVWNDYAGYSSDSLHTIVTRSFNLTVTFSTTDIMRVDGKATLDLRRASSLDPWTISMWKDESNY